MQCLHFQARQAIHLGRSLRQVLTLAHLSHDPLLGEKHMTNKIPTPEAGAKWPLYSVRLTADAAMGTAAVDDVAGFRSSAVRGPNPVLSRLALLWISHGRVCLWQRMIWPDDTELHDISPSAGIAQRSVVCTQACELPFRSSSRASCQLHP